MPSSLNLCASGSLVRADGAPPSSARPEAQLGPGCPACDEILRPRVDFTGRNLLFALLEVVPGYAAVFDKDLRVLGVNGKLFEATGAPDRERLVGKRLGELFQCSRLRDAPSGCGTSKGCGLCGAYHAMNECHTNQQASTAECRLALGTGQTLDLEVVCIPLAVEGLDLVVLSMRDISAEKRRRVLERVFFHDVRNTASGVRGLAQLLTDANDPSTELEFKQILLTQSERLLEEIDSQRQLSAAESGELETFPTPLWIPEIIYGIQRSYASLEIAKDRVVRVGDACDAEVVSDMTLLCRVLGNMTKNALEATKAGAAITLSATEDDEAVVFAVHNPGVMPEDVKLQVFHRSFSTKGAGRGIGTYSIKLFGERYLGGKVDFVSSAPEGTSFLLRIPKKWAREGSVQVDWQI